MSTATAVPYRQRLCDLRQILHTQGSLGLLLVDVSELAQVEHDYGSRAFEEVLASATELVFELQGTEIRSSDVVSVDEKGGDAFLIFLSPRRNQDRARVSDLQAAALRVEEHLNRKLARLSSPYLRGRREVTVGFSLVFFNPLVMPERLVARLVDEAWECVRVQRMQRQFQNRCRLQDILLEDQLTTLFQPVVDLRSSTVVGYEALTRGPAGTALQSPANLFDVAGQSDLVFELDRSCRGRALLAAQRMPESAKLFLNVFPASMYDPEFQGSSLIKQLEALGLGPERIVLEITEKYAIENYTLFVEALQNFTQMGFSIAVDDIGAGYSGLEKIAHLNPRYLKFDMQLVRDIDGSYIRQEMARALKAFADKMESTIIAEGIEREGELRVLMDLDITYGQGYYLGRPAEGFGATGHNETGLVAVS
jgi:EAL domain-containing protein (putative c-di-GMP-specific phosphodiesterase class I)